MGKLGHFVSFKGDTLAGFLVVLRKTFAVPEMRGLFFYIAASRDFCRSQKFLPDTNYRRGLIRSPKPHSFVFFI